MHLAYAVGSFAENDDSFVISQLGGESPFGSVLASLGSDYAVSLSPDGSGRSMYAGLDITTPLGNGKGWYIRDSESGEIWSPFFAPACEKADEHEVVFSPGQVRAYTLRHKIASTLTVATLPDRPVEVWLVKIENRSATDRSLTFTTFIEPCVGPDLETSYKEREKLLLMRRPLSSVDYTARFEEDMVLFHSSTLTPVRYQTEKSEFVGDGRSLRSPRELDRTDLSASDGPAVRPVASLTVEIELPVEGEAEFAFVFGVARSPEHAMELAKGLSKTKLASEAVRAARGRWEDLCSTIRIDTPDRSLNALVNTWLPYEAYAGWIGQRTGGVCLDPLLTADLLRRLYALSATAPDICRENLTRFAAGISVVGAYSPDDESILVVPPAELLWLPACVARYVAETGDASVTAERVGPSTSSGCSGPALTLKDHCERILRMCLSFDPSTGLRAGVSTGSGPKAEAAGLLEHAQDLWSAVAGSSDLPLASFDPAQDALMDRQRPERPEHPEERSLPRRVRYLQSICRAIGEGEPRARIEREFEASYSPESDCGVACSLYAEIVERILGIQPFDGGLRIHPRLPDSWSDCEIIRWFRGDTYRIHLARPMAQSGSGVSIVVDGEPAAGDAVPYLGDGLEHQIDVIVE